MCSEELEYHIFSWLACGRTVFAVAVAVFATLCDCRLCNPALPPTASTLPQQRHRTAGAFQQPLTSLRPRWYRPSIWLVHSAYLPRDAPLVGLVTRKEKNQLKIRGCCVGGAGDEAASVIMTESQRGISVKCEAVENLPTCPQGMKL